MATITAPPAAESPTVRVFKGDDLPNSVLADRARYARFRATAAAAKALALAAEGGAGDECIGALAAAVEALEASEQRRVAPSASEGAEARAWAPLAIGGHRECAHSARWPRSATAAALRRTGLLGVPPSRPPPPRPLVGESVLRHPGSGSAVARGLVPPERCQALIQGLRKAPALQGAGDAPSRVDGQPRCQLTLARQRAWCAECYVRGGPFASFEVVGSAEWWPVAGTTVAAAVADARASAAAAFGDAFGDLPLWGAFVRRYSPEGRSALPPHTDRCCLTVNIALSAPEDYEGGGCFLLNADDKGRLHCPDLQRGDALLHLGDAQHGAHPVTAGERHILVLFLGHPMLC